MRVRICAVCRRATSPSGKRAIYPFSEMLKRYGIVGERAHAECVAGLVKKRRPEIELLRPVEVDEAESGHTASQTLRANRCWLMNQRRRSSGKLMARPPLNVGRLTVRIGRDLPERMDAVLHPKEKRADLIRDAIEAEIRRRERAVIEAEIRRREKAAKRKKPNKR